MSDEVIEAEAADFEDVDQADLLPMHPANSNRGPTGRAKPPMILSAERRAKALNLRLSGATYTQIAEAVGYKSATGARNAVITEMEKLPRENAKELRAMQLARLHQLMLIIQPQVMAGDLVAVRTMQGIMRDMNELMGIGAEFDADTTGNTFMVVIEGSENEYVQRLRAMANVDPDNHGDEIATTLELHNAAISANVVEVESKEDHHESNGSSNGS